ncbi:hypothetical protein CLIB1444_10S00848 [[Candida] jaroonii]|uniref:Uncharacterized protein n=1 Tax=[Candida] jaroonii TaxID=467808 RepID=A0ACA9YD73_9ASCO|nr:hypothetical protein CLIB1444_10S00848 [[Candida] jaroonii]
MKHHDTNNHETNNHQVNHHDMNNNQLKSHYLFNLLHTSPNYLRSNISIKLSKFNHEKSIKYPESWEDGSRICVNCGILFIPGLNVKISHNKDIIYHCSRCDYETKFPISEPMELKPTIEKSITKNKAKDRKKKRNQSLHNLLQQKKKPTDTLNLMEFMN